MGYVFFHSYDTYELTFLYLMIFIYLQVKVSHHQLDGILMASTLIRTRRLEDEVRKVSERLAIIWRHVDV